MTCKAFRRVIRYYLSELASKSNNSKCLVIQNNVVLLESWKNLHVGECVLVLKNQRFPADMLIITTSNPEGAAYIDTSTLDGEKHLKPRFCCKETIHSLDNRVLEQEDVKKAN